MNHDRDTSPKCPHVRTDSSRQAGPVSQNKICQCKQHIHFGYLFLQSSISRLSESQLLLHNSKDMLHFGSYRRFLVFPALNLGFGTGGIVFGLAGTAIDFVSDALASFVLFQGFRPLLSAKIATVSIDPLLFTG